MLWRSTDGKLHMIYHDISKYIMVQSVSSLKPGEDHQFSGGGLDPGISMADVGSRCCCTSNHRKYMEISPSTHRQLPKSSFNIFQ